MQNLNTSNRPAGMAQRCISAKQRPPPGNNGIGKPVLSRVSSARSRTFLTQKHPQSAISRSSSQDGFANGKKMAWPFTEPNEDEVFIVREQERQKKHQVKLENQRKRIWDKGTATTRAPLKRIHNDDPAFHQAGEQQANSYSQREKEVISKAMSFAQSRVQFAKDDVTQPINEFVSQKRQMFRVQLSYRTVRSKIDQLDSDRKRREDALKLSGQELERDEKNLLLFVENANRNQRDKEGKVQLRITKRNELDNKINKLETDLQTLKTEIGKAKISVDSQAKYREFLSSIFKDEFDKLNYLRDSRLYDFKKNWIVQIQTDRHYMRALFECQEENSPAGDLSWEMILQRYPIQSRNMRKTTASSTGLPPLAGRNQAVQQGRLGTTNVAGRRKGLGAQNESAFNVQDLSIEAIEARFDQLQDLNLIALPDDFYDEAKPYDDVKTLERKLADMEQTNLQLIGTNGEISEYSEKEDKRLALLQRTIGIEASKLVDQKKAAEDALEHVKEELIIKQKAGKKAMFVSNDEKDTSNGAGAGRRGKKQEKESNIDLDKCLTELKGKLIGIYDQFVTKGKDLTTTEDTAILEEIERKTFLEIESINKLWMSKIDGDKKDAWPEMKQIENRLYKDFQMGVKQKEQIEEFKKREEKKQEMEKKRKKQRCIGGRRITERSRKPDLKKEEIVEERAQEDIDMEKYIQFDMLTAQQQGKDQVQDL